MKHILFTALVAVALLAAYLVGQYRAEPRTVIVAVPDTVRRNELPPEVSILVPDAPAPVRVVEWLERPEVEVWPCPVPTALPDPVLSSRQPLEITARRVAWTYFDPEALVYRMNTYEVPVRRFSTWLEAEASLVGPSPFYVPSASLLAGARWHTLRVEAGPALTGEGLLWQGRLSLRLAGTE